MSRSSGSPEITKKIVNKKNLPTKDKIQKKKETNNYHLIATLFIDFGVRMLSSPLALRSFAFSLFQKLFSITSFASFLDYQVIVFTTHRERTLLRSSIGCYPRCAAEIGRNCSTRLMP